MPIFNSENNPLSVVEEQEPDLRADNLEGIHWGGGGGG